MRIAAAVVLVACVGIAPVGAAPGVSLTALDVCMVASPGLSLDSRERRTVADEASLVWRPLDVRFRWVAADDGRCHRVVVVKADSESGPGESAIGEALGWVPFVDGRARPLIFLRVTRARRLVASFNPGTRPAALDRHFAARLLARSVAHEMGHALLHIRAHGDRGVMQAVLRPADVFAATSRTFVLSAAERASMRAALDGVRQMASR